MFANTVRSEELSNKIITVLSLICALIIGISCYDFARRYLLASPVSVSAGPRSPGGHASEETIALEAILNTPFFGRQDASAIGDYAKDAQPTALQLELKGVIAATRNTESGAIIAEPGKPEKLYRSGDMVLDDTKLVAVFSDRVLLFRNQKYEVLSFKQENMDMLQSVTTGAKKP